MKKYVFIINKMQCGEVFAKLISSFKEAQELVDEYINQLNREYDVEFKNVELMEYFDKKSEYNCITLDDGSIIEVIKLS